MRDIRVIIADFVRVAGSLEEAKELVAQEVAKGDCEFMLEGLRNKRIEFLWAEKEKAAKVKATVDVRVPYIHDGHPYA